MDKAVSASLPTSGHEYHKVPHPKKNVKCFLCFKYIESPMVWVYWNGTKYLNTHIDEECMSKMLAAPKLYDLHLVTDSMGDMEII
jgi:hypothetical protein